MSTTTTPTANPSKKKEPGTKKFTLQLPENALADLSPGDSNDNRELTIPTNTKNVLSSKKETLESIRKHQSDKKREKQQQERNQNVEEAELRAKERKAIVDGLTAQNQHLAIELENSKMKSTLKENQIRVLDEDNFSLRTYVIKLENSIDAYQEQYENVVKENNDLRAQLLSSSTNNKDSRQVDAKATDLFRELGVYLFGKAFNENNESNNRQSSIINHSALSLNENNASSTRDSQHIEIYQSYASESRIANPNSDLCDNECTTHNIQSNEIEENESTDEEEDEEEDVEEIEEEVISVDENIDEEEGSATEDEEEEEEEVLDKVIEEPANELGLCTILETTESEMTVLQTELENSKCILVDDTQMLDEETSIAETIEVNESEKRHSLLEKRKSVTFNEPQARVVDQRPPLCMPKTILKRKSQTGDEAVESNRKSMARRKSSFGGDNRRRSKMYSIGGSYQGPLLNEDLISDAEKAELAQNEPSLLDIVEPTAMEVEAEPVSIPNSKPNSIFKSRKKKIIESDTENTNPTVANTNLEEISDYLSGCLSQDHESPKSKTPKRAPRKSASKAKKKLESQELEDKLLISKIEKTYKPSSSSNNNKKALTTKELAAAKPPIAKKKSILTTNSKKINTPAVIDPLPTNRKSLNETIALNNTRMSIETIYENHALDTSQVNQIVTNMNTKECNVKLEPMSAEEVNKYKRNFNHVEDSFNNNENLSLKKLKLQNPVDKENHYFDQQPQQYQHERRSRTKAVNYKENSIVAKMRRDGDTVFVKNKDIKHEKV